MEGLDTDASRPTGRFAAAQESRLIERWIAFLFMATLVLVAAGSLLTAMLAPFKGQ